MNGRPNFKKPNFNNQQGCQGPAFGSPGKFMNNQVSSHNSTLAFVHYKNALFSGPLDSDLFKQKVGIILYDNGDIMVADFVNGKVEGHFFYFKSGLQGLCCYGIMRKGKVEGDCYIYSRSKLEFQINFKEGRATSNAYFSNQAGISIISRVENQIREGKSSFRTQNQEQIHSKSNNQFSFRRKAMKPVSFFEAYFANHASEKSYFKNSDQMKVTKITQSQTFFGCLVDSKPHGLGILFQDDWPVCYGTFKYGQLFGMGRVQQSQTLVLDGIFQDSRLKQGWIIDYQNNQLKYGSLVNEKERVSGGQQKIYFRFNFQKQFQCIDHSLIQHFRKQHHVASASYSNQYCEEVEISSMIPKQYIEFMVRQERKTAKLKQNQQQFIPSFISEIEKDKFRNQNEHFGNEASMTERQLINFMTISKQKFQKTEDTEEETVQKTGRVQSQLSSTKQQRSNFPMNNEVYLTTKCQNGGKQKNIFREVNQEDSNRKKNMKNENEIKKLEKVKRENRLNLHDIYKKYLKAT